MAQMMNWTPLPVSVALSRARKRLREWISANYLVNCFANRVRCWWVSWE